MYCRAIDGMGGAVGGGVFRPGRKPFNGHSTAVQCPNARFGYPSLSSPVPIGPNPITP